MLYRVNHTTKYHYREPVTLCHNLVHLTPRQAPRQSLRRSQILVNPLPGVLVQEVDYFGNATLFFTIQEPHPELTVTANHLVEISQAPAQEAAATMPWDEAAARVAQDHSKEGLDAYQYVFNSRYVKTGPDLSDFARPSFPLGRPLLECVLDLTGRIHADFTYDPQATTIATPLAEVMSQRRGVCQDFAHLEIGCLRCLGLPARYVSGYLSTQPPPDGKRLVGADASHAWLAVYCPGSDWLAVDPTNNQVPHDKHITLAWGRDYDDVSPIKGIILGGGRHSVRVSVDVVAADQDAA
jgi:transglutaminase-like putative cysteine protease